MRPIAGTEGPIYRARPDQPEILRYGEPSWPYGFIGRYRRTDPPVTVSPYGMVNDNAYFLTGGEHRWDFITGWPFPDFPELDPVGSKGPIYIGPDAMVGFQALILSGVTVHAGAIVGARAVVTKDVPSYAIVTGVPAKVVGYRYDEPTREALLRIAWWDWPKSKVNAHRLQLMSTDVAGFVSRHDPDAGDRTCSDC